MQQYFETVHTEPGQDFPIITYHDTFEEAEAFAEAHGITEIFGSLDTYVKCWFCGEWVTDYETDKDGTCERCQLELMSRGEY